jgi:hypothetical protein
VAVAVAVIWYTDCADRADGDSCCNTKEGDQPIEALYGKTTIYSLWQSPQLKKSTHKETNKATFSRFRYLIIHHFKWTAVESHRFKVP